MQVRDRIKELRRVKAGELIPNAKNWRVHNDAQRNALRGILAEVGYASAVLCRETPAGLQIIDGHLRAETTPDAEIPCLILDVTEAEADKLLATFDPLGDMAEADPVKLDELLRQVDTGCAALQEMLAEVAKDAGLYKTPEIVEDEVPEPPAVPVTKPGDLWLLGDADTGHRLLCGDSTKAEDVGRLMGGRLASVCFTSPPYASQRKYDESSGFTPIPPGKYVEWWGRAQELAQKSLTPDGSLFLNIKEAADDGRKQDYVKRLVLKSIDEWDWLWVEEFCWPRPALPLNPNMSHRFKNGWESVFHFAKSLDYTFNPDEVRHESDGCFSYKDQKAAGKQICDGGQGVGGGAMSPVKQHKGLAYPSNVLPNFGGAKVVGHSAAFPVGLPAFFLRCFSNPKDVVYEPFSGSGTTFIAAEQLGRMCCGVELSPAYCDVILTRWSKLTGKRPKRESDGLEFTPPPEKT